MNPIPFILLNFAGILTLWVYIYRLENKLNRLLNRKAPEFPDLRKPFIDLQERITSEAEETRRQSSSHAKNNQAVVKTLTGVVKQLPKTDELAESISNEATSVVEAVAADLKKSKQHLGTIVLNRLDDLLNDVVENTVEIVEQDGKKTRDTVAAEHKKTRKEAQEIKTRLTWSRKRERADLKDDETEQKRQDDLHELIGKWEGNPDLSEDPNKEASKPKKKRKTSK